MKKHSYLLSIVTLMFVTSCADKAQSDTRDIARSIVEKSKAVELFIAGVNSSIRPGSEAHKKFSEVPKSEIEELWIDLYVEEFDTKTLLDIQSFLVTKEGNEWVEFALSQADGENPRASQAAQIALSEFTSDGSGKRWVAGMQSFTPKIMASIMEKMIIEQ